MDQALYKNENFLKEHIKSIIDFYYPACMDYENGGYYNQLLDDGTIFDHDTKHLVGTCRFIYNFSLSYLLFKDKKYQDAAAHGVEFLSQYHKQPNGGYAWVLQKQKVEDGALHCYGHAFVMLALAGAIKAEVPGSRDLLEETWDLLEKHFWEKEHELYVDEISPKDWNDISPYRGQNANMHMCEALLVSYEATKDAKYLERANSQAHNICIKLTEKTNGYVWEHYRTDWSHDWNYNIDDPKNLFKPYGYLPGHFTEWSKLLMILNRYKPADWQLKSAELLFTGAIENAWDEEHKTLGYTFAPDGKVLDTDRYYWLVAETMAASAILALHTGKTDYWDHYNNFWDYAQKYFIDHKHGGWYRVLDKEGNRYNNQKSPASKTDYHPVSACFEIIQALNFYGNK